VSRVKRDAELVAAHVTLNWRQAAVRYMASVGPEEPGTAPGPASRQRGVAD